MFFFDWGCGERRREKESEHYDDGETVEGDLGDSDNAVRHGLVEEHFGECVDGGDNGEDDVCDVDGQVAEVENQHHSGML